MVPTTEDTESPAAKEEEEEQQEEATSPPTQDDAEENNETPSHGEEEQSETGSDKPPDAEEEEGEEISISAALLNQDVEEGDVEKGDGESPTHGEDEQSKNNGSDSGNDDDTSSKRCLKGKYWIAIIAGIVVIAVALAVSLGVLLPRQRQQPASTSSGSSTTEEEQPSPVSTTPDPLPDNTTTTTTAPAPMPSVEQELLTLVESALDSLGVPTDSVLNETGHQYKALQWLADDPNLDMYNDARKLQRYALAAFCFATNNVGHKYSENPGAWINANQWLTNETECGWYGIDCDNNNTVYSIELEGNNLSGSLPLDLALIGDALRVLVVTGNVIVMEGGMFDLFLHFHRLTRLHIDDNFMVYENGLPEPLKALVNLEEIRASYNLLSGKMDNGVLPNLTKLTYLEVESNFLTGDLVFLSSMTSLVYVYLRNNALSARLSFFNAGTLTNLFSLWLDRNDISESIPTQIGHLSSLASLSITESSLTGTIPTETGSLSNLQRIWLSGNRLTGTIPTEMENLTNLEIFEVQDNMLEGAMPTGVCTAVASSDYEQKALVADCQEVVCVDCCTRCE